MSPSEIPARPGEKTIDGCQNGVGTGSSSGIVRVYPTDRDHPMKSFYTWINGKRTDDDIGPYWRIHDKLYDLTDFIHVHPGGKDWLEFTKGTDITEPFESFHFGSQPGRLLSEFYVKDTDKPRNSLYTFYENGFYKTLKSKVYPVLQKTGKGPTLEMLLLQDGLAAFFIALIVATSVFQFYPLAVLSGIILALCSGCAHNFIHQRDSFRMYYLDLSFFSSFEWRITHVFSHHIYPNTLYDYEVSVLEPLFVFIPWPNKSILQQYGAILYEWVIIPWAIYSEILKRLLLWFSGKTQPRPENFLPFAELALMSALAPSVGTGISLWVVMHCACSAWMVFFCLAGSHHHPDIYHEGDTPRELPDWGLCQLDAVRDKIGYVGNLFMVATNFGNHSLHHLFPTVDHSRLDQLYPVFLETCREFSVDYELLTQLDILQGKYKQLAKIKPNPCPPGSMAKI